MKTDLKSDVCAACASEAGPNVVETVITQIFRGEELEVLTPVLVCRGCNFQFFGTGQLDEMRRRTADAYRKKHNLLTSVEIVNRRKALGETQEEFAKHLKVGIASVKRWETWLVQDKRSDELIREKTEHDLFAQRLAAVMRGVGKTPAIETACSRILEGEEIIIRGIAELAERLSAAATTTCWRDLLISSPALEQSSEIWAKRDAKEGVLRIGAANQAGQACLADLFRSQWDEKRPIDSRTFKISAPNLATAHSSRVKFKEESDVVSAAA
jgi:putative zinc finger/helix-turn-helix YgiT family protein